MQSFRNLRVWEKSHRLTLDVYASSKAFPRDEMFGLTSQMRRSSASIGMNIAEGCCRKGDAEMVRFLQIAMGQPANLSTNFCSLMIWNICTIQSTSAL
jgi:four helix bundle protein